jgi:hypothetical protein
MKYQYLYTKEILNHDQLQKKVPVMIDEYNNRPNNQLNGLTPAEVYLQGKLPADFKRQCSKIVDQARIDWLTENRKANCGKC